MSDIRPVLSILEKPETLNKSKQCSFTFKSSKPLKYVWCVLDNNPSFKLYPSKDYPEGDIAILSLTYDDSDDRVKHELTVQAVDTDDNLEIYKNVIVWTNVFIPIQSTLVEHPSDPDLDLASYFLITTNKTVLGVRYSLNNNPYVFVKPSDRVSDNKTVDISLYDLSERSYTIRYKAVDEFGFEELTEHEFTWNKVVRPITTIVNISETNDPKVIELSVNKQVAYIESYHYYGEDKESFSEICSEVNSSGQERFYFRIPQPFEGKNEVQFTAVDTKGYRELEPVVYTWYEDKTVLYSTFIETPAKVSQITDSKFTIVTNKPVDHIEYTLDDQPENKIYPWPEDVTNKTFKITFTSMQEGFHNLSIRAVDGSGYLEDEARVYSWKVEDPPVSNIIKYPISPSTESTATFKIVANKPLSHALYSLNGSSWKVFNIDPNDSTKTSASITISNLKNGDYTIQIKAVDLFGAVERESTEKSWSVEGIEVVYPNVGYGSSKTILPDGVTEAFRFHPSPGVYFPESLLELPSVRSIIYPDTFIVTFPEKFSNQTSGVFTFSSTRIGATYQISLDGSEWKDVGNLYKFNDLVLGSHLLKVRSIDRAGNIDPSPAEYSWSIDTKKPVSTFVETPPNISISQEASIRIEVDKPVQYELYSLDNSIWLKSYPLESDPDNRTILVELYNLNSGPHNFRVKACDIYGNIEVPEKYYNWFVNTDRTPPDTIITTIIPEYTNKVNWDIDFMSPKLGCTFEVALDVTLSNTDIRYGEWVSAKSPYILSDLADGHYVIKVRAIDLFGDIDVTPAQLAWNIDTVPPKLFFVTKPTGPNGTFEVVSNKTNCSYHFIYNDSDTENVVYSPIIPYSNLPEGVNIVKIYAKDMAGNSGDVISYTWTIDSVTPNTFIDTYPIDNSSSGQFTYHADKPNCVFEVTLDSVTSFKESPFTFTNLSSGFHTFSVRAKDLNGNFDVNPKTYTWEVKILSTITVTVFNAINAKAISGALVSIDTGESSNTNTSGEAKFTSIKAGLRTVTIAKDQFVTETVTVTLTEAAIAITVLLSPSLWDGAYRAVLRWGYKPSDLDIHMYVPSGSTYIDRNWANKGSEISTPSGWLDIDDTDGYGPETVTAKTPNIGIYQIWVYNYSQTPDITSSNAEVSIYSDQGKQRTYKVPLNLGTGYKAWHVCDIDCVNKIITDVNLLRTNLPNI
jgi:hypothetical protein